MVSPCNQNGALHVPVDEEIHLLDCNIGMVILEYSQPRIMIKKKTAEQAKILSSYVQGMVKKICRGTSRHSATCTCPVVIHNGGIPSQTININTNDQNK
jgi:hypothetical protein